jgi:hypothetical protein
MARVPTKEMTMNTHPDTDIGSCRARALRRKEQGIQTIGKIIFGNSVPKPPTPASRVRLRRRETNLEAQHRKVVEAELRAIDAHSDHLTTLIGNLDTKSFQMQEAQSEIARLRLLRAEVEQDREPILTDRDGRTLNDRDRAAVRHRTQETASSEAYAASKAQAEGDHRRAGRHRHDALRARHLAEYACGWRKSLRGFSFAG